MPEAEEIERVDDVGEREAGMDPDARHVGTDEDIGEDQDDADRDRPSGGAARGVEDDHRDRYAQHVVERARLAGEGDDVLPIDEDQEVGRGGNRYQHDVDPEREAGHAFTEQRHGEQDRAERQKDVQCAKLHVVEGNSCGHDQLEDREGKAGPVGRMGARALEHDGLLRKRAACRRSLSRRFVFRRDQLLGHVDPLLLGELDDAGMEQDALHVRRLLERVCDRVEPFGGRVGLVDLGPTFVDALTMR